MLIQKSDIIISQKSERVNLFLIFSFLIWFLARSSASTLARLDVVTNTIVKYSKQLDIDDLLEEGTK